ncbi:MAG TPA: hypothetical protein VJA21_30040 [Verrucomicrobiae bacterium]
MKTRMLRLGLAGLVAMVGVSGTAAAGDDPSQGATPDTGRRTNGTARATNQLTQAASASSKAIAASDLNIGKKAAQPRLSPWSSQVLKLAQAGVYEDVVFSYIDSAGTFNLTADQIITLTQSGVPRDVIAAMIQHDADIFSGVRQVLSSTVPESGDDTLSTVPAPPRLDARSKAQLSSVALSPRPLPPNQETTVPADFGPEFILEPLEAVYEPPEALERSPVRKPYAVQLTAPILVWRTEGRMPNTVLLEPFP